MNTVWSTGKWIFTLPRFELRFYRLCCFGLSLSLSAIQRCAESPLRKEITWILTWLLLLTVLDWMLPGGSEKNGCAVENPELGSPADKELEFCTWLPLPPILDHWTAGNFARQSCINPSCPFDLSVIARLYCTVLVFPFTSISLQANPCLDTQPSTISPFLNLSLTCLSIICLWCFVPVTILTRWWWISLLCIPDVAMLIMKQMDTRQ